MTGNTITWDTATHCQRYEPGGPGSGVVVNAGFFYMAAYSPGRLAITWHPEYDIAAVTDCNGVEDLIDWPDRLLSFSQLGAAGFGLLGCSPCGGGCSSCTISGEPIVAEGTGGHVYTVPSSLEFTSWQISGNATITAQSPTSVTVSAGPIASGRSFVIDFDTGSTIVDGQHCLKKVTIDAPVPVRPTTWSSIKALHH